MQNSPWTIIGAGPVGSLLGLYLNKNAIQTEVFERRPDPRNTLVGKVGVGRSINLAISARGLNALAGLGLEKQVLREAVPMRGRLMHAKSGQLSFQPYSPNSDECIHSISRGWLNCFLLDEFEKQSNTEVHFSVKLEAVDFEKRSLGFAGETKPRIFSKLIGTDGSASVVRESLPGLDQDMVELAHGYKEFLMPALSDGKYAMEKNALHIWPRGQHMMIALPNSDGSYTCTLFLPLQPTTNSKSFAELKSELQVKEFFESEYPDFCELVPDFLNQFIKNPLGRMATLKCNTWRHEEIALLVGDAAHAIVPFFGQGMNCGFEDVVILDELLKGKGGNLFANFYNLRKTNTDAIADMAVENFVEMSAKVADAKFLFQKNIEKQLQERFPQIYKSRYSMVSFSLLDYRLAYDVGRVQDQILAELTDACFPDKDLDFSRAEYLIQTKLQKILPQQKGGAWT